MGRSTEGYGSSFLSGCSPPNTWICGRLRAAGVPVIGKCLIQVYLKRKSSKCAKLLNAVRIAGCCGAAGGIYSHPPLSCNQIAGERQRIWRRIRLGTRPHKAAVLLRFHFGGYRPASPLKAPHEATRWLTGGALACVGLSHPTG